MTATIEFPEPTATGDPDVDEPSRVSGSASRVTARARVTPLLSGEVLDLVDAYVREVATETVRAELVRATVDARRREWYTVKEAARRLGISEEAVRMRARRNRLTSRHQGRTLYIAARSVDDLT